MSASGTERALVDDLVDSARAGRSRTLFVEGEPGIGKTRLCELAVDAASDMTVLRLTGVEWEADLGLTGLAMLLRPIRSSLPKLPDAQQEAVDAVLGEAAARSVGSMAIATAVLGILAPLAERRPVLLVVDDAQWVDDPTWHALTFALRRLDADRVAALVTSRPDQRSDVPVEFERHLLDGLDAAGTRRLLAEISTVAVERTVAQAVTRATGGNPLAIRELARALSPEQLAGTAPLPDPLPVGRDVRGRFGAEVAELPPRARLAAATVAIAGSGRDLIAPALTTLGLDRSDVEPVVDAGLCDAAWTFVHPLVRAAAADAVPRADRRRIVRALAEAAGSSDPERRAWFLAAATDGPDETVANALEEAAGVVAERGSAVAAVPLLVAAADRTPPGPVQDGRLVRAASVIARAGRPGPSVALLSRMTTGDPALRVDAALVRGEIGIWDVAPGEPWLSLREVHAQTRESDPARAAVALFEWMGSVQMVGRLDETVAAIAAAEDLLPRLPEPLAGLLRLPVTSGLVLTGDVDRARSILDEHGASMLLAARGSGWTSAFAQPLVWLERVDEAIGILDAVVDQLTARSEMSFLPLLLTCRGEACWWAGRWPEAIGSLGRALDLADAVGQPSLVPFIGSIHARVAACIGDRESVAAFVGMARALTETAPPGAAGVFVEHADGLDRLTSGDVAGAAEHLAAADRVARACGLEAVTVVPYVVDLAEALARAGRRTEASDVLAAARETRAAQASPWFRAASARVDGLLGVDPASAFATAVEAAAPFERGRSLLAQGQWLRREKRLREARTSLAEAAETFRRLGARPWEEAAAAELRSAGGAPRGRSDLPSGLTSQELQVVLAVAGGATNREAAASLFISPKTVEYHLTHAYAKLGVTNRAQLVRLAAEGGIAAGIAPSGD